MKTLSQSEVLDAFEHIVIPEGCIPEFPLDFFYSRNEKQIAYTIVNGVPRRQKGRDYIMVNTYTYDLDKIERDALRLLCFAALDQAKHPISKPTHKIRFDVGEVQLDLTRSDSLILAECLGRFGLAVLDSRNIGIKL